MMHVICLFSDLKFVNILNWYRVHTFKILTPIIMNIKTTSFKLDAINFLNTAKNVLRKIDTAGYQKVFLGVGEE